MRFVARGQHTYKREVLSHGVLLTQDPMGRTFSWFDRYFHFRLPHAHFVVGYWPRDHRDGLRALSQYFSAFGSLLPLKSLEDSVFALPLPNVGDDGFACTGIARDTPFAGESEVVTATLDRFFSGVGCEHHIRDPDVLKLVCPGDYPIFEGEFYARLAKLTPAIWDAFPHKLRLGDYFRGSLA